MFPIDFADRVIQQYTNPGDVVLDPFAGRGTAVFSAAARGRQAVGIELSPVGWIYAKTKLQPARMADVSARILELGWLARRYSQEVEELPPFFHQCFTTKVAKFLVAARNELHWRERRTDRTAMALLLVYLHGKRESSLSNQMRQTKSLSPDYAMRWWSAHHSLAPDVDPVEFMQKRLPWRYAAGVAEVRSSEMHLGDSTSVMPKLARRVTRGELPPVRLLFTSPPYYGITNYHYDQWLRLWLLGGAPNALRLGGANRGKFEHRVHYRELLTSIFSAAAKTLARDATVYIRTDQRTITYEATIDALQKGFPDRSWSYQSSPFLKPTQTALFGDRQSRAGEIDIISYAN